MEVKRNIFQRLFGIPATKAVLSENYWNLKDNKISLNLLKCPEISSNNSAIRLENEKLPHNVLVIKANDGNFYAFKNSCTHGGRRLDPVPGNDAVQCCSIGKSTFTCEGKLIDGSAKEHIVTHKTSIDGNNLIIDLS